MIRTRRWFLRVLGLALCAVGFVMGLPRRASSATPKSIDEGIEIQKGFVVFNEPTQKNMVALAHALVPGTKDIPIRKLFMDEMSQNHGIAASLDAGLWNITSVAHSKFKKHFSELTSEEEKKAIINHIRKSNGAFFRRFRERVINIYYSNPTSWKRLSYNGPPQPRGFMDYLRPPKT